MRVQIIGPMSGIPHFNWGTFQASVLVLTAEGHEVFNPCRELRVNPTGDESLETGYDRREAMRTSLTSLCAWAEAVHLLDGWRDSEGARQEYGVAAALGLVVIS